MTKTKDELENFIGILLDELISMPDEQLLADVDPAAAQAEGMRLLQAAKAQAGRARLAAAKAGLAALSTRPSVSSVVVSIEEARRFIAHATNDGRYTLAARSLGEMPDDEVLRLYRNLKTLEQDVDGEKK